MKSVINKLVVLVLNRNWQAVNVTTPAEAVAAMMSETATALDIQEPDWISPTSWASWIALPVRENDFSLGTVKGTIRVPTVIVLNDYDQVPLHRPSFSLRAVWQRDGGRCQYTGKKLWAGNGNIDHVLPRSRGGPTNWQNCVLSDKSINTKKADQTPQEAGLSLLKKPQRPAAIPVTYLLKNTYQISDWNIFLSSHSKELAS